MKKLLTITAIIFFGYFAISAFSSIKLSAATVTWYGYNSGDWSDDENWDVPPQEGDDLFFPYDSTGVMNCDVGHKVFKSMTFDDSYVMNCPNIYVSESMSQYSARSLTVNAQINLEGDVTMNTAAYTFLTQDINLNGHNLTLNVGYAFVEVGGLVGSGNVTKVGHPAYLMGFNTFSGDLIVQSGEVIVNIDNTTSPNANIILESGQLTLEGPGSNIIKSISGDGTLSVGFGAYLTISDSVSSHEFTGSIVGSGVITTMGTSSKNFSGNSSSFEGMVVVNEGNLTIDGDMSNAYFSIAGGVLQGIGSVGSITCYSGTLSPGHTGIGILTSTGDIVFSSDCSFSTFLLGTTPGSDYAQLIAEGSIVLNDSILSISPGYQPAPGSEFVFLKSNTDSIYGNFSGESTFMVAARKHKLEYESDRVILKTFAAPQHASFTISPASPKVGQTVTITSTWTGTLGAPTGILNFYDGEEFLGYMVMVGGTASKEISSFVEGMHNLTVVYSGDGNYDTATSDVLEMTVVPAPVEAVNSGGNQVITAVANNDEVEEEIEIEEELPISYAVIKNNENEVPNTVKISDDTDTTEAQPQQQTNLVNYCIVFIVIFLTGTFVIKRFLK